MASPNLRWDFHRLASPYQTFTAVSPRRPFFSRTHSVLTSLEESASLESGDNSSEDVDPSTESEEETLAQPLTSEQVFFLSHNWHSITVFFLTSQAHGNEEVYLKNLSACPNHVIFLFFFENRWSHFFKTNFRIPFDALPCEQ